MARRAKARDRYSLYIVRCADGSLYTGIARDVDQRLAAHAGGVRGAKYLRGRAPFELVFRQVVGSRSVAQRLEYRVKALTRARKLDLVAGVVALDEIGSAQTSGSSAG